MKIEKAGTDGVGLALTRVALVAAVLAMAFAWAVDRPQEPFASSIEQGPIDE